MSRDWLGALALLAGTLGVCGVCLRAPLGWVFIFIAMAGISLAASFRHAR